MVRRRAHRGKHILTCKLARAALEAARRPTRTRQATSSFSRVATRGLRLVFRCTLRLVVCRGLPDYYGVDKSWYGGGSWARPIFDAAQTVPSGGHFILSGTVGYITIDNFEMKNQNIAAGSGYGSDEAIQAYGSSGVVVENVYIHDFMTSGQLSSSWVMDYAARGGILRVRHTPQLYD